MNIENKLKNKHGSIFGLLGKKTQRLFRAVGPENFEIYCTTLAGPKWRRNYGNFEELRVYRILESESF